MNKHIRSIEKLHKRFFHSRVKVKSGLENKKNMTVHTIFSNKLGLVENNCQQIVVNFQLLTVVCLIIIR